ncbi:MAG: Glu/Leu/Phe/Val dehydrogenase dimerization domain-containing protein [Pseudonocardiaceae bacterium]
MSAPGETVPRSTIACEPRPASAASRAPARPQRASVIHYRDPVEGFDGYLAFDGPSNPLAAGGFRVQRGLTADIVVRLAEAMALKQRLLGLAVDGAKCGLDLDPRAPGKRDAMRRFIRFLRPYLFDRYSMGPDMGTGWDEIEDIARREGIPSVKIAVAKAQGLSEPEFLRRVALLDVVLGGATLGRRRAGHGLAHAALAANEHLAGRIDAWTRVGIQGFGTLGRAAALGVAEAGVPVTAIVDVHGGLRSGDGLPVEALVRLPVDRSVPQLASTPAAVVPPEALFDAPVDLLILAACEDGMNVQQASALPTSVRAVVVGANLGLSADVEDLLHRRGIVVVPDFVGGCGGSASMDALFGPVSCPTAAQVLDRTGASMRSLVHRLLDLSARSGGTPRDMSATLCRQYHGEPATRPYGGSSA